MPTRYCQLLLTVIASLVFLIGTSLLVQAQDVSATDQGTPSALAKGAHPLGSYGGGDIDVVNLFNGNLALRVPLAAKDGRSGMTATVLLAYNSKVWRTVGIPDGTGGTLYYATIDPWDVNEREVGRGWTISPGHMTMRRAGKGGPIDTICGGLHKNLYTDSLTTLTFTAPDGTEYMFRDVQNEGRFLAATCTGGQRGRKWYTTDGTAATFISDTDIFDSPFYGVVDGIAVSGDVYLRDGTRFHITNDAIEWQQDRNGNRINYRSYNGFGAWTWEIRDTLGRLITVHYYSVDPGVGEAEIADVVVTDATGTQRTTHIYGKQLQYARSDGSGIPTMLQDFPVLDNADDEAINPTVLTRVELPSGHNYQFLYNRYAEVSRAILPTGGRIDYTYVAGEGTIPNDDSGVYYGGTGPQIYRRVKSRSTFVDQNLGSSFATKTGYDELRVVDTSTNPVSYNIEVTEKYRNLDNSINGATRHFFTGTPLDDYGRHFGAPAFSGYKPWKEGKETRTEYLDDGGDQTLRAVDYTWEQWRITWANIWNSDKNDLRQFENNPRLTTTTTTVRDSGQGLKSKVEYEYDDRSATLPGGSTVYYTYNNVKKTKEYDFGSPSPGALLRQTERSYETSDNYTTPDHNDYATSDLAHIRSLVKSETVKDQSLNPETTTNYDYDQGASPGTLYADLTLRTISLNNDPNHTERHHASYNSTTNHPYRGNLTTVTSAVGTAAQSVTARNRYDVCGNIVKAYGPRATSAASNLFSVDYLYDPTANGDFSFAYPTKIRRWVNQTVGGSTSEIPLETERDYFLDTGQLRSVKGENTELTTYTYADPLGRLTYEALPTGGFNSYTYSGTTGDQWVRVESKLDTTRTTWAKTTFDGLGRSYLSQRSDLGVDYITVETKYDIRGRAYRVSNPKRASEPANVLTAGWTRTTFDAINRVRFIDSITNDTDGGPDTGFTGRVETVYADPPLAAFPGKPVTRVIDQAGKQRSTVVDGLGRVVGVNEAPNNSAFNYLTSYVYDARGNLKQVVQGAQTARQFIFDAMGRVTQATMPECGATNTPGGSTNYGYDVASNLITRTDPRNIVTTIDYDELNRPKSKNYSNTGVTPDVAYVYDGSDLPSGITGPSFGRVNTKGRLFAVISSMTLSTETDQEPTGLFYGYDPTGRTTNFSQMLDGQHYYSTTAYNEASLPTTESYSFPGSSNALRDLRYNDAGQVTTVLRGTAPMADAVAYSPAGAVTKERLGDRNVSTSLYHSISYNSRLQPTMIYLGTTDGGEDRLSLRYFYGTVLSQETGTYPQPETNNGNIGRIEIRPDAAQPNNFFEQLYTYDPLNRISSAKEYQATGTGTNCGATGSLNKPTNLGATVSGNQVTLTWNDSDPNVCSFIIKRSTTSGGPYSSIGTTAANVKTFVDSGLQTGTYCYRVVAHNDSGDSPDSDEICKDVSACLPPATPSNLSAVNANGTQVNLTWTDNSSDETSFVLERMDVTNYQPFSEIARPAANATSYSDTNVTPLYHYKYRIKAIRTSGGIECPSAWVESPEVTLTPSDWALKTDGFDDYAATTAAGATSGLNVTGNITVEAWVVLYDTNVTDMIVSKHRTNVAEGGYQLFVTNTNQLSFVTYTATGAVAASIVSAQTLQTKQWYHLVGSYSNSAGGKIGVAVNGQITSATVGLNKGAATSSSHVQLGRVLTSAGTGSKFLRGKIDEARISSIVRYSTNFNSNLEKDHTSDANTKALWKMNNGTGTSATDSSSNAYTATLYNGVLWKAGVTTNYIDKQPHARHGAPDSGGDTPEDTSPGIGEGSAEAGKVATGTANWNLDYDYDQWGNMWMKNTSTQNWLPYKNIVIQTNYRKNQVATVDGNACLYDDAGNLYRETVNGNQQDYSFDAENRMWKAVISGMNGGTVTYVYDGDGRRVKKRILNGTTTKYIYNSSGQLVAEFEGTTRTKEYVYGPTGMLAAVQTPGASETIEYTTADHLGTPRVITQPNGTVLSRHDYVPFGVEIPTTFGRTGNGYPGTDDVRHKFTSKERDNETGLDFFGARYYASGQGRFLSPDPVPLTTSRMLDPQRINLYSYVRNTPMKYLDPDGRDLKLASGQKKSDVDRIVKDLAKAYRKESGRAAIERMEKSDISITIGNGKLPSKVNLMNSTVADTYGRTDPSIKVYTDDKGNITGVAGKQSSVNITIDFQKRDDAQTSAEINGGRAPASEADVVKHELGHTDAIVTDAVAESKRSEDESEDVANGFVKKLNNEKDTISQDEAEKRVREILGGDALPKKEIKKD